MALHRDLIALRKSDPAFRGARPDARRCGPRAGGVRATVLRPGREDRLLVVNLGRDLHLDPAPEPLLAPPEVGTTGTRSGRARTRSTAGNGTAPLDTDDNWQIPGEAAVVLAAADHRCGEEFVMDLRSRRRARDIRDEGPVA